MDETRYWPLAKAQTGIVIGGCCGMAYTQLTTSPATVQFARSLGGTGLHIGLIGAFQVGLVVVQLLSAMMAHRFAARKPVWFWLSIVQRVSFLPAALGPWLFPEVSDGVWIFTLLALTAVNHSLLHFATPLWMSWMGDYLPKQSLGKFLGVRHSAQQWTAAAALLVNSFFFHQAIDVRAGFAGIIILGAVLGVADILMFCRIYEPPAKHAPAPRFWKILAQPWQQRDFRSFIEYACFWQVASMIGAPFISMYLFEFVGMDLFRILLLWTLSWVGGAVLSRRLGSWADHFGQRPVLVLCTLFKPLNMIALLCCPARPDLAFWILAPTFMFDAFLNAGILIASNAFLLKHSPAQNRTMFVAAGTGFAGICGGLTSIAAGAILTLTSDWSTHYCGQKIVNFHLLFAVSVILRFAAVLLAARVREPAAAETGYVVRHFVAAAQVRMRRSSRTAIRLNDDSQHRAA